MSSESTTAIVVSIVVFIVVVIGFAFDRLIGWRLLGFAEAAWGAWMIITRRVPYGIEGRPPTGYVTGIPAVIIGLLAVALGAFFVVAPRLIDGFFSRG